MLRASARKHLRALAAEGERKWTLPIVDSYSLEGAREWRRRVDFCLADAFGRASADVVIKDVSLGDPASIKRLIGELNDMSRRIQEIPINEAYRGGGG